MRPLNIKFTAFGPYPKTQTIDFTELQNSNMFVISGPTGSGKTTIFDAISFALYGSASGSDRTLDMFRSDFAPVETMTQVEFEFAVKNQKYKITRCPAGERPKLRGVGMRKIDASVKLEFGDQVITAQIEVANKIEEVLGLTKEQFKQIVLLPQGEFKKLLMSDSRSKEVIFRKIFDTGHIQKIQEQLRTDSSELKRKIEDSELQINTILDAYPNIANTAQLSRLHKNTKVNVGEIEEHLQTLNLKLQTNLELIAKAQQHTKDQAELQEIQLKLDAYQKNQAIYNKYNYFIEHLPVISNYQRIHVDLSRATDKLNQTIFQQEQLQQTQDQTIGELTKLRDAHTEITAQYEQVSDLQEQLDDYQTHLKLITDHVEMQTSIDNYQALISKLTTQIDELELQKTTITTKLEQIEILEQQFEQNNLAISSAKDELAHLTKQQQIQIQIEQLNNEIINNSQELQTLNSAHHLESATLSEYRAAYIATQSGLLAAKLEPGKPCSVCGSLEHPNPATINTSDITDTDIAKQEQIVDKLNNKINQMMAKLEVDKALTNQLTEEHQITDLDYQELIDKQTTNLKELEAINLKLSTQLDKQSLQNKLTEIAAVIVTNNQDLVKYQYAADDLRAKLTLSSEQLAAKPKIETEIDKLQQGIKQTISTYEQSAKNLQACENQSLINTKELGFLMLNIQSEQQSIQAMNDSLVDIEKSIDTYSLAELTEMLSNQAYIKAEYNNYLTDTVLLTGRQTTLEQIISEYQPIDVDLLNQTITKLNDRIDATTQIHEQFVADRYRQKTDLDTLKAIENKVGKLIDTYQLIADISDVANGKTTSKISFERYMLAIYFKQIISRANIYFKAMTNNRFELEYKSPHRGRGAQGLDLNIVDNYTTKVRDVKSLSGGETFKAALAMALGLSDIVQMNSGGIQIDTIFIDEGFGSLDIDSLNSAIDTLISIESEGRIVGIISHVEELKNQVSNKIEVTTGPEGSSLAVHFN